MSRLIVKNLPSYVTPARLREHFEQKGCPNGTITDFKVALKSDGTSRRFGFVGYKTEQEALAAKEWFDRTFLDSTRINVNIVEVCQAAFILERALIVSFLREQRMRQRLVQINDHGLDRLPRIYHCQKKGRVQLRTRPPKSNQHLKLTNLWR